MSCVDVIPPVSETAPDTPPRQSRLIEIDFLRGIAILLVLGAHWVLPSQEAGRLSGLGDAWASFGSYGVDLFFVLSGFLVGGLLMQELKRRGHIDLGRFVVRRGFKIWPSYYVYLVYYFVYLLKHDHLSALTALTLMTPNLFHLQNYLSGHAAGAPAYWGFNLRHTWSLAVEEHFYLALPLLLMLLSRRGIAGLRRWLPGLGAGVMIVCLGLRCLALRQPGPITLPVEATHLRLDSLFVGVLLAYLYHLEPAWLRQRLPPRRLFVAGLGLLCPFLLLYHNSRWAGTVGYTLVAASFACLLLATVGAPERTRAGARFFGNPVSRAIAFLGTYSYSVYLWHLAFGQVLPKWLVKHGTLASHPEFRWLMVMAVYILSATAAGVIFGKIVEYPALAVRDRLFPSRTRAALERKPA